MRIARLMLLLAGTACSQTASQPGSDLGAADLATSGPRTWTLEATPNGNANLGGIWGSSSQDVYAVGYDPAGKHAVVLHSTGDGSWAAQTTNNTHLLDAVWGSSKSDVYAVGYDSDADIGLILHSTGDGTWMPQTSNLETRLLGVWGSGPGDVYAGGLFVNTSAVAHSTGGGVWTAVDSPTDNIFGIWGSAANDLYALGSTSVFHSSDGKIWTVQPMLDAMGLASISGSGAHDVYVLGLPSTVFSSTGAGTWTAHPVAPVHGSGLSAIWAAGNGSVWAVGDQGRIAHSSDGGTTWSFEASLTTQPFLGVWGVGDEVYAAGTFGLIAHRK